jgi:hypothetical protein
VPVKTKTCRYRKVQVFSEKFSGKGARGEGILDFGFWILD